MRLLRCYLMSAASYGSWRHGFLSIPYRNWRLRPVLPLLCNGRAMLRPSPTLWSQTRTGRSARALRAVGVLTSDAVAAGTPDLAAPDAERFDRVFEEVQAQARERIGAPWITEFEDAPGSARA